MSMHTQMTRGLVALPVAALLIAAGALSPAPDATLAGAPATREIAPTALPRAVDFHSMLPGALHIVKRVKLREG